MITALWFMQQHNTLTKSNTKLSMKNCRKTK